MPGSFTSSVIRSILSAIRRGRRGIYSFFFRTAVILVAGLAIAQASQPDRPRPPRAATVEITPRLASPALLEETGRLLDADSPWLDADDFRHLPALIDLLESDRGRDAGEAIARIFRAREILDDRGRPPVDVRALHSVSYLRAQRASLAEWFRKYAALLRGHWKPRPGVASPF